MAVSPAGAPVMARASRRQRAGEAGIDEAVGARRGFAPTERRAPAPSGHTVPACRLACASVSAVGSASAAGLPSAPRGAASSAGLAEGCDIDRASRHRYQAARRRAARARATAQPGSCSQAMSGFRERRKRRTGQHQRRVGQRLALRVERFRVAAVMQRQRAAGEQPRHHGRAQCRQRRRAGSSRGYARPGAAPPA